MNTPIIIFFLASTVAVSYAAVGVYPQEPKPAELANQEGCYMSIFDRVLPYDTPYYPENGQCMQYICKKNNETIVETCGVYAVPENCTAVTNTKLNYPDCCDVTEVVCPPTEAPTTTSTEAAPTSEAPTTTSTEAAPTSEAPTTTSTEAATTTSASPQQSSASAYASSQPGQPPVVQSSATPGASAAASAS